MLIGLNKNKPSSTPQSNMAKSEGSANGFIMDVTTENFELSVLKASLTKPVVIDFWAPWCGPCKQLMPILEKAIQARQGKIILAKVNIDDHPQLAQAFRVQSVPMVVAMYQGQPVTGFAGLRPPQEIEHLLDQLIALHQQNSPDTIDIPALLSEAQTCLNEGDLVGAQTAYAQILSEDEQHSEAYCGIIRVMLAANQTDQAEAMADKAPSAIQSSTIFKSVLTAIDLAKKSQSVSADIQAIQKKIEANPKDFDSLFSFAEACYAVQKNDEAVDALISIIRQNKDWEDGKAKALLLQYFEAWGFSAVASVRGRKKLSSVLFS